MPVPAKVVYATENEYRQHFIKVYCQQPLKTFDGISVRFEKSDFEHCMYESSNRNGTKDLFSKERSQRIEWIRETLENPAAELYQGWDNRKKRVDPNSRVAIVFEEFVVVIRMSTKPGREKEGRFLTAYLADNSIGKIRGMPKWRPKK